MKLLDIQYNEIIDRALNEDLGWGDITTEVLIDPFISYTAYIKAKSTGIISGTEIASRVFQAVDKNLKLRILIKDGKQVKDGDKIMSVKGSAAGIIKAERVALNFLQHLSGIATLTSQYVKAVKGLPVSIVDTRKTIPGLRILEKYAVLCGGGKNHRMHLGDCILIKNNHIAILNKKGLSISRIISRAKEHDSFIPRPVEIEVRTIEEAVEAARAGADIIMLDNMNISNMKKTVSKIKGKCIIEASGGINLDNVRKIAETGVNVISIGALTHSAKALDMSLSLD